MIYRGVEYLNQWLNGGISQDLPDDCFNLANGYSELLRFDSVEGIVDVDSENHLLARRYYRLAASGMTPEHAEKGVASNAWTNYGNLLDGIGRNVEALSTYDVALRIQPTFGMALGNKGVALKNFAPLMPGYSHLLYIESIRLLESALQQFDLTYEAKTGFKNSLQKLYDVVEHHSRMGAAMEPEDHEGIQPADEFHKFLCDYCAEHNLFLSPISRVGKDEKPFYGDPLYLMHAPRKDGDIGLNRYIWFLNEIKQEFVLGRYFLVQSQYTSPVIDAADAGVTLAHPDFGFPVYFGTYVQLLQSALKQAVAVLDKIAYFLYDYCKLKRPKPYRISFLTIWGDLGKDTIQQGFKNYMCPYLFALFTLARDLHKNGDWHTLIEDRGIVTHRFMILHESPNETESIGDVPVRHMSEFLANTIFALKIARAAVMYLIMFVNHFEYWKPIH